MWCNHIPFFSHRKGAGGAHNNLKYRLGVVPKMFIIVLLHTTALPHDGGSLSAHCALDGSIDWEHGSSSKTL